MQRQEYYRRRYKQSCPDWQDSLKIYIALVKEEINNETRILDIGCGHADFFKHIYAKTVHSYGLDPDKTALTQNNIVKHKKVGSAENIPYERDMFDLVVCAWVLEHIADPQTVFQEIRRVLKPGGYFIFLTPNALNYNVWLTRLTPARIQPMLVKKLYGREEADTYPKYYRANSMKKLNYILTQNGFKLEKAILNRDPSYIAFNDLLYKISCLIESLTARFFPFAKTHIIAKYQKIE